MPRTMPPNVESAIESLIDRFGSDSNPESLGEYAGLIKDLKDAFSRGRGRPNSARPEDIVRAFSDLEPPVTHQAVADRLGIHKTTVGKIIKRHGLKVGRFSH